jgi:hypothetical protein
MVPPPPSLVASEAAGSNTPIRRIRFSPDGALLLVRGDSNTTEIASVTQTAGGTGSNVSYSSVTHPEAATVLAEPAIDAVWAPFAVGGLTENCFTLTTCRNTPVQLWDCTIAPSAEADGGSTGGDDGSLSSSASVRRASYYLADPNDVPFTAHSLCWSSATASEATAGYGHGVVAAFNIEREGKGNPLRLYTPIRAKGILSALAYNPAIKLFALGSLANGIVELMDPNTNTCSGVLRGHNFSGVTQIEFALEYHPYLMFSSSRGKDARLASWDLRYMTKPLALSSRSLYRQLPGYFSVSPVSQTSSGSAPGLHLYLPTSGAETPLVVDAAFNLPIVERTATSITAEELEQSRGTLKESPSRFRVGDTSSAGTHRIVTSVACAVHNEFGPIIGLSTGARPVPLRDRYEDNEGAATMEDAGQAKHPSKRQREPMELDREEEGLWAARDGPVKVPQQGSSVQVLPLLC